MLTQNHFPGDPCTAIGRTPLGDRNRHGGSQIGSFTDDTLQHLRWKMRGVEDVMKIWE